MGLYAETSTGTVEVRLKLSRRSFFRADVMLRISQLHTDGARVQGTVFFGVRLDAFWLPQPEHMSCGHVLIPTGHLVTDNGVLVVI